MALAPRIEPSFSLRIEEQLRTAGHGAGAPRRRSARLVHVAAIALTLLATSAFAGERAGAAAAPASQAPAAAQDAASPPPAAGKEGRIKQLGSLIVLGAVSDPRDAGVVDDSALPELPVIGIDTDAQQDSGAQSRVASGAY